jgi:hypothetical protein
VVSAELIGTAFLGGPEHGVPLDTLLQLVQIVGGGARGAGRSIRRADSSFLFPHLGGIGLEPVEMYFEQSGQRGNSLLAFHCA